jgi:glycosyltransferase involved in cell wall biosynthesis
MGANMRIAINAIPLLSKMTGIGNCIYNISKHLLDIDKTNDYLFYYGYFSDKLQSSQEPAEEIQEVQFNILKKSKPFIKKVPFLKESIKKAIEEFNKFTSFSKKIDIYYEPNYIPTQIQSKTLITTVHDFSFHYHPEWHPRDRVNYFKKYFYSRIGQSDLITTDSRFIKKEALEVLGFSDDQVHVVPMGYDKVHFHDYPEDVLRAFKQRIKLPEKFVLFVGSIEPRKNIFGLLKAYEMLPDYLKREYKLVLAGFSGWENKAIMDLINSMKEHVVFLGYLNIFELAYTYNLAAAFAYPSLYEGFGLPPLEAMACSTPVLVSNVASLPEVCGKAALYCNPLDEADIARQLQKLLEDATLQKKLRAAGLTQARLFTWDKSAQAMAKVFMKATGLRNLG